MSNYKPSTSAQISSERVKASERPMTHHRFRAVCEKLVAELAYLMPDEPFKYLQDYLTDPEGALPQALHQQAREQTIAGHREISPAAVQAYFVLHDIRPFLDALGEKLVMDGDQDDIHKYICSHLEWSLDNLRKATTTMHY